MKKSIIDQPPGKMLKLGLRLPIWLYRLRLGWLLGHRFILLHHKGRKSGRVRQTVIEVVDYEKETNTYYVVSGWGIKSDWYQNIKKDPNVTISCSGRTFTSVATFIPLRQSVKILERYTAEHPAAFRELSGVFLGEQAKSDPDIVQHLAEKMPMVAFCPE